MPPDRFDWGGVGSENCNRYFLDHQTATRPLCQNPTLYQFWISWCEDSTAGSNMGEVTGYTLNFFPACLIHFMFLQCALHCLGAILFCWIYFCFSNVFCTSPCVLLLSEYFQQLCGAFTDFTMHLPCFLLWTSVDSCLHIVISNVGLFLHLHL